MNKKKTMKNIKTPNKFNTGGNINPIGGALSSLGGVVGGLISNGFQTKGGAAMSAIGDAVSQIPGAGMIAGPIIKALSGVVNRGFGTKWDQEGIAKANSNIEGLNSFISNAGSYDSLSSDFSTIAGLNKSYKASDLGKDGWFVNRTQNKAKELNEDMVNAYNTALNSLTNTSNNIAGSTLANLERNYAAFGGLLNRTHGADFSNGLMFINNGGTHESNPYEGIPISMDQEGNPNLVEEGEVVWNDYVFSNRLKVPKKVRNKYKLRGTKDLTFAEAVEKASKESEERPNDPISIRGLENVLMNMAIEQETLRSKNKTKSDKNKFAGGGPFGMYYTEESDPYIVPTGSKILPPEEFITNEVSKSSVDNPVEEIVTTSTDPVVTNKNNTTQLPWLRYAPVIGSAINVATSLFQKPDYTNANNIISEARRAVAPVKFNPIGDYMTYNPFDTEYYANQLRSVSGATRRNIMNTSGGNRAAAMAGILAADNNTMNQMGDLYRKAAEYNLEQRHKVADFNRATNMYNSEGFFKADAQNQQARLAGLDAIMKGYLMKEEIDSNLGRTRSAALTGLFNNIGNIGIDNANRADRDMLIRAGAFGTLSEKPNDWSEEKWKNYQTFINS
jgi:hypothetical protein